jgi:hypothetical protein
MSLSALDLDHLKAGRPVDPEEMTVGEASLTMNITRKKGTLISLVCDAAQDIHYRVSYDPLLDGDFEEFWNTWAKDSNGDVDVEGASLRKGGPWMELGTAGAVTLNKTGPLFGTRDAKMALDSANTRFLQQMKHNLKAGLGYQLRFNHKDSNASYTMDYAITEITSAGVKYLQAGGTFTTSPNWFTVTGATSSTQITKSFTSDEATRYIVWFKPTGAQASETIQIDRVYVAEVALATDHLHAGGPDIVNMKDNGRVSAIKITGSAKLYVSTLQ